MSSGPSSHDRRHELLADRALFGLTAEELRELEFLGGDDAAIDELALTAAALDLGLHGHAMAHESLPDQLRQRTLQGVRKAVAEERKALPSIVPGSVERRVANELPRRDWLGWAVAAAALAVAAFSLGRQPNLGDLSPFDLRSELLAAANRDPGSVFQADWTKTEDPAAKAASGKVIWSDKLQRGVMEFSGLEANDPKQNQYQLWIFDADRPEATPVDGGVFDIPAGQKEVVVPIDARLPITKATLFAITVEKPGGVVVSDRKRLPLLAPVPKPEDAAKDPPAAESNE
ncbi:anti-sigma factor [Lacipirellula limnantheis]|uniref:Anti-sigma-K factor rskA n=1 Tax=Lacipirellula limnantheis TaxID=2528024 RepID=A0A517U469_9BACT|nr:anti-sigma factor [Lacipirellula limnantheis]QDT75420.1 Anti-sigma-K factor rskA [Lacipirellula limnantheis]